MNGDFGAEVEAALNARLAELWSSADEARARIEQGIEALPKAGEPSPALLDDEALGGAPVSFDAPEEDFDPSVDAEGIPLPEENL